MTDKPPKVNQPTLMPSRKVMAGAFGGVIAAAITQWTAKFAAQHPDYLAFLDSDAFKAFVPLGAMFIAGYVFRERKQ